MAQNDDLVLRIGVTEKRILDQMKRVEERSLKAARRSEQAFVRSNRNVVSSLLGIGSAALRVTASVTALAFTASKLTRVADSATQMRNSLRVAGLEGEEMARVYERLFQSAQKNSTPVSSLVDLYSKLALTQNELGVSSEELLGFTDNIAVALRVAGTDATAASGSLLQLSQALGGGVVRAEEFNSILEGTPTIAQAVARGLKEAGGSVAELRKLVVDGQVSSTAFFRAFEAGSGELQRQASNTSSTVGQAFVRIGNSLVTIVGEFDQASGASEGLADIIGDLADGLDRFDAASFVSKIQRIADAFADAEDAAASWLQAMGDAQIFQDLNDAMGITEGGQIVNPDVREAERKIDLLEGEVGDLQSQIENNTAMGFDNTGALARLGEVRAELAAVRAEAATLPRFIAGINQGGEIVHDMSDTGTGITSYSPPPRPATELEPISLQTYPASGDTGSGGGSRSRRGGRGRGGSAKAETPFFGDIEKDLKDLQRQISLVGKSNEEVATARARWELLDEAKKRGLPINDELNARIDEQAGKFGQLTAELERNETSLDQYEQGLERIGETFADIAFEAENFGDIVTGVLKRIAAESFSSGVQSLIGNLFPAGSTGGNIIGSIFGGFRARGGPVRSDRAYVVGEDGPELFRPDASGEILNASQLRAAATSGRSSGGGTRSVALTIDLRGTTGDRELDAKIKRAGQQILAQVPNAMREHQLDYE